VVYPIVRLADHGMTVSGYVHALEDAVISTLAELGLDAGKDPAGVGVWAGGAKIAAIGVRIRRGVSMHGLALNVSTDLRYFDLIIPCGLRGRSVTALSVFKGLDSLEIREVKSRLAAQLTAALTACTAGF
jgi:lipoate-protein ligase B